MTDPLANRVIRNQYNLSERNEFYSFQKTSEAHTPNDEYENFVTTH